MGKLLSLLARDDSNCCSPQKYDVFLDFEIEYSNTGSLQPSTSQTTDVEEIHKKNKKQPEPNRKWKKVEAVTEIPDIPQSEDAQPTDGERPVFEEVQRVLRSSEGILEELGVYKGAGREIREAITTPTEEFQKKAWVTVVPLVVKLKRFYDFSLELESIVPKILGELCSGAMTPTQHLETQQALVKQFAEILEFVLKFDEYKMKTPAIQNDFSYYRRTVSRQRMTRDQEEAMPRVPEVSCELANRMSLFYAHATPMLRVLSEATSRFVQENTDIPIENTTETLSTMAKVCLRMLESPSLIAQFQREETQLFVLRVMVGLVILYDHVHPHGAFVKASNVDVKGCVKLLKDQPAVRSEGLLNALRYTTKHLNEEATPKHIKNLLAA